MKIWTETYEVLREAGEELQSGRACAVVVLTKIKGSSFRRPGAKLLIRADGSMLGSVSGGCLENDLRERAVAAIKNGRTETVHYRTGSDEDTIWGLGLGCDGELDLMIYPIAASSGFSWIHEALKRMDQHASCFIRWPGAGAEPVAPAVLDAAPQGNDSTVFTDHLVPPPDLFVVGAGDDAIPLVKLAALAGLRVTVIDHRSAYLEKSRFPDAYALLCMRPAAASQKLRVPHDACVVIKNHALETDKQWAHFFDGTPARYIGLLGPKKRCADVRAGMTTGSQSRIYGPAGLDIGSEGAEQIALSILSEILAACAGRIPTHLRDRQSSIH